MKNDRDPEYKIDDTFIDRWSPRSFYPKQLTKLQINALFEAAKWAPSCYNEQPWFFVYASKAPDRKLILSVLYEKNKLWAVNAPLLIFAVAKLNFRQNGKKNKHALFDLGAAWMSLALQARKMGLFAHAMSGFNQKKSYDLLNIPKTKYNIAITIAVGYCGNLACLDEELRSIEYPNNRNPLKNIVFSGLNNIEKRLDQLST